MNAVPVALMLTKARTFTGHILFDNEDVSNVYTRLVSVNVWALWPEQLTKKTIYLFSLFSMNFREVQTVKASISCALINRSAKFKNEIFAKTNFCSVKS